MHSDLASPNFISLITFIWIYRFKSILSTEYKSTIGKMSSITIWCLYFIISINKQVNNLNCRNLDGLFENYPGDRFIERWSGQGAQVGPVTLRPSNKCDIFLKLSVIRLPGRRGPWIKYCEFLRIFFYNLLIGYRFITLARSFLG